MTTLYNVITPSGTILSAGGAVELTVARDVAMAYTSRYDKIPTIETLRETVVTPPSPGGAGAPVEPDKLAVATQLYTVGQAKYCLAHQRAVRNSPSTDRNKVSHQNRYHWSAVMRTALRGGELRGNQGEWLATQEQLIARAVASHKLRGSTYPRLAIDDLTWSF